MVTLKKGLEVDLQIWDFDQLGEWIRTTNMPIRKRSDNGYLYFKGFKYFSPLQTISVKTQDPDNKYEYERVLRPWEQQNLQEKLKISIINLLSL